jgi:adenosylcobinamide-GDP ribazoletransferase
LSEDVSFIKQQLRLFFTALQFFSRLPIPRWVGFDAAWLQPAVRYFPLVGWLVAAFVAGVYWLASMIWPAAVAVLLSMLAGILLTGALHEDGLADVCDGFGGGATTERVLTIMKDSRVGAYGVIGLVLVLALKAVALHAFSAQQTIIALLFAHPLSRWFATVLIWCLDYAREEGKAKAMAQRMGNGEFAFASLCGWLPVLLLMALGAMAWQKAVAAAILAVFACGYLVSLFLRRIGGYTGDCLGAVQQTTEVCLYLGLLIA